ncbi:MAG: T9SS type A sorting domain-containing protein [Bacteroidetes bacterium]|nr:T9SS type A sorting domain-containing protein [Bacteroidota bacterium]
MKNKFTLAICLFFIMNTSIFAQSYELTMKNFVQVSECQFEYDIYLKNNGATSWAYETSQTAITSNAAIKNGGDFQNAYLVLDNTNSGLPLNQQLQASNFFNSALNGISTGSPIISTGNNVLILAPNDQILLSHFIVKLRNATNTSFSNFASAVTTFAFKTANTKVNRCPYTVVSGNIGLKSGSAVLIATKTLTVDPSCNARKMASHYMNVAGNTSNVSNWNNAVGATGVGYNTLPSATSCAIIGVAGATMDANLTVANLNIKSTSTLAINPGVQLSVDSILYNDNVSPSALTLLSDASGTASLKNSTVGVTATIQRYIPLWTATAGYHLLSSPVSGQAINPNFVSTPATSYDFYLYNPAATTNVWENYKAGNFFNTNGSTNNFVVGKGYLASYATSGTHNFAGTMNVADVTPSVTATTGFNLIGNPYACAIQGNIATWKTGMSNAVYVLDGATNTYKDWNGVTGTFNGEIPAMQGFFVQSTAAASSITIKASAKKHSSNAFLKTTLDNHLQLNVQSPNNTSDATIIYFKDENSNDVDNYDAMLMPAANPSNTQIYSYINSDKYSIDALAAYSAPIYVNVGFEPKVDGNFTITAGDIQSFNAASSIILQDLKTNTTQDLRSNPTYTFTASTVDNVNRFKVLFDLSVVGINNVNAVANTIYSFENSIYIKTTEKVKSVSVFNMLGQEVENIQQPTSNVLTINQTSGYYTVRVITEANVYSQKVYIK